MQFCERLLFKRRSDGVAFGPRRSWRTGPRRLLKIAAPLSPGCGWYERDEDRDVAVPPLEMPLAPSDDANDYRVYGRRKIKAALALEV